MNFLDLDAAKCAEYLCDQDCFVHLEEAIKALQLARLVSYSPSPLLAWVKEDGFNYHWLGYFCDRLQHRVDSGKYFSEIVSLRRNPPAGLRCRQQTPFYATYSNKNDAATAERMGASFVIASYRIDYIRSRHGYAVWKTSQVPGWVFRVANTILPPRERSDFLLRVQPSGPCGSDNAGSLFPQRGEVREGPVGEITGPDGDKLFIHEG